MTYINPTQTSFLILSSCCWRPFSSAVCVHTLHPPLGVSVELIDRCPLYLMNNSDAISRLFIMDISVTLVQLIWVLAKCFRREMMVWSVLQRLTPTQLNGYVIRCNQRERRTSRSHQHLHIAVLCELERIHCTVLIHLACVCVHRHVGPNFSHKR